MMQLKDPAWQYLARASEDRDTRSPGTIGDVQVKDLVMRHLQEIQLPYREPSRCLIKELGGFLARATELLSMLAHDLADCPEVIDYLTGKFDGMDQENGMSDTQDVKRLNDKHRILRDMVSSIDTARNQVANQRDSFRADEIMSIQQRQRSNGSASGSSKNVSLSTGSSSVSEEELSGHLARTSNFIHDHRLAQISAETPHPEPATALPAMSLLPSDMMALPLDHKVSPALMISPTVSIHSREELPRSRIVSPADNEGDPIANEVRLQLEELGNNRGTGEHVCPYGFACQKGGLDKDGRPLKFTRNSAYKAHLQKHVKMYVCDMPGCPARQGFARIDQLQRHKDNVPHTVT